MKRQVRAWLKPTISEDAKFFICRGNGGYEFFFGSRIPLKRDKCRYFVETYDGIVPVELSAHVDHFSMRSNCSRGNRKPGQYAHLDFPDAEAEVSCVGNDLLLIEVEGKNISSTLALHKAIETDQLMPLEFGGLSATELFAELAIEKKNGTDCSDDLHRQIAELKKPWIRKLHESIKELINDLHRPII